MFPQFNMFEFDKELERLKFDFEDFFKNVEVFLRLRRQVIEFGLFLKLRSS